MLKIINKDDIKDCNITTSEKINGIIIKKNLGPLIANIPLCNYMDAIKEHISQRGGNALINLKVSQLTTTSGAIICSGDIVEV